MNGRVQQREDRRSVGPLRANLGEVLHLAQERGGVPPSSFRHSSMLVAAAALATLLLDPLTVPAVLGQEPTPGLLPPTDPRTDGVAPGLGGGGGPLIAAAVVVAIAAAAVLMTVLYVRLVARR